MFRSPILILLLILGTAPWQQAHALYGDLPEMGDSTGNLMTQEEERRIGAEFMRNVRQSLTLLDDPEINGYLQDLGRRLASHSDRPGDEFSFFIVQDPRINAFAAPGGYIGINSGLILNTGSESELAAVLAHEIAHVTQRHLARASEAASRMNLPLTAAILAAIILGGQDPDLAQAAITAAVAGGTQRMINFTRSNEKEADRVGIRLLHQAGFDPTAMPSFFRKMLPSDRLYREVLPDFLKTHPVTLERISDSENRAAQLGKRVRTAGSRRYQLMRAKLKVLTSPTPIQAIEQFRSRDGDAARYGYALALSRAGRHREARREIGALLERNPATVAYQLAQARIEANAGRLEPALEIYRRNLRLYPLDATLTIEYGMALLQAGQAAEARRLLHRYLTAREASPRIYRMLAQAEKAAGYPVASFRAMAEYYYLEGLTLEALRQLRHALAVEGISEYDSAAIQARIRQLRQQAALEAESRREKQKPR